ncbi:MAG: amino acid adenylation domain-containing protein [Candidatus Sulfotelmatobacter sp.]
MSAGRQDSSTEPRNSARMTDAERQRILVEWNNTCKPYPADRCVHELVEAQAKENPGAVAMAHEGRQLSYQELNARANQLARLLRQKGVGCDVPVAICLKRSLELPVALLAILKAGGACVPLDPDYPKDRLAYILEDSRAPVLITQPGQHSALGDVQAEVLYLDADWKILSGQSPENLLPVTQPESLAYIIYTSGSTGKPRGVLLTHRGLVNHGVASIDLYGIERSDRVLQFSSISFDIAVEEIFPTWFAGATVVLRRDQMSLAATDFLRWIKQQRITVLDLPTAYWHELVHELAESHEKFPERLRLVIVGGEKASASAYAFWLKAGGTRVRWVNTYGPTEASVIVSAYEPDPSQPFPENLPIGRPIANVRLYVLDSELQPVAVGEPGELHIGGPGVARGYLNHPELTEAKFIADPFSQDGDARLYKTGDLVRYLPDGNIEFQGRIDFQVKIRGFRIELGEIEAVLEKHSGVAQAVVTAREVNNEKRLAAYIVALPNAVTAGELRRYLKDLLPEYMMPTDFVFLKSFPLTPNGKVDRRALPAPEPSEPGESEGFVAARDEFESRMVSLWEQVLGKRPIGVRDNFFELGGHSLLAVRLTSRIEKQFGKKLTITALIQAPTVESLVSLLRDENSSSSLLVPLQTGGSKPIFFFVHGLGGTVMRFHELARHMVPDQPFYCFQAQGMDGKLPCLDRVEDMAALYLEHLRAVQPQGPYFLGGYSFGGLVALEMARRLVEHQEEVRALTLVDTYLPAPKNGQSLLEKFFGLSTEQKLAYLKKRLGRYRRGVKRRIDALSLPRAIKDVREACAVAEERYRPQVYPGCVVLFRASEKALRGLDDPQDGWRKYAAGRIEVHEIDGDHGNILNEPQVKQLAEEIRSRLEKAQAESPKEAVPSLSSS